MRETFRRSLAEVESALADMADVAATAIERATVALLDADLAAADRTAEHKSQLDERLKSVEEQAYDLIALQAPVASDLRVLVTVVRLGTDIDRMGALAAHVAEAARRRHPEHTIPEPLVENYRQMGTVAAKMARDAGAALRSRDTTDAGKLATDDDVIDGLRLELFRTIVADWAYGAETAVDVALLGRYYERFADHAVAIGEAVVFLVTGAAV